MEGMAVVMIVRSRAERSTERQRESIVHVMVVLLLMVLVV